MGPSSFTSRLALLLCAGAAAPAAATTCPGRPAPSPPAQALNITILQPNVTFAPSPLPLPGGSSDGEEIVRQLSLVTRATAWKLVDSVPFEGDTFEPEGMVRLGADRYLVSAGEYTSPTQKYPGGAIINGTDRTAGSGFGHLILFDGRGRRIADATITRAGDVEYHNGGLDYDGTHVWATLSQYRPNTTATVVRVDPATLVPEQLFHVADHQGGVVHDLSSDALVTLNWGGRDAYTWDLRYRAEPLAAGFNRPQARVATPSYWVDYQDCKYLGRSQRYGWRSVALCSGVTALYGTAIGGVAIVDLRTMQPLWEVPLTMVSALGVLVTMNPVEVALVDGKVRLYFLPDQRNSTLYVYEPQI